MPSSASRRKFKSSRRTPGRRPLFETLENRSLLAAIASDGFEAGGFASGLEQWATGAWTAADDATVISTSSPHAGTRHAQLRSSTGDLQRAVDVTGLTDVRLQFWSKVNSFEANDKALVSVSPNGSTWTTLLTLNKNQSDNTYRDYNLSVPTYGNTLYVRFDAAMSAVDDFWYIDDVAITGTPSGPPQISISDATAVEGDKELRYIDDFVSANSGGLRTPRGVVFGPEDGMLYVATGLAGQSEGDSSNQILRFDPLTGAFVDVAFTSGDNGVSFDLPWDMTFGPDNKLYVSARRSYNILRYDPGTDTLEEFVPETRGVYRPCGLAFGPDGNLYVSNADNGTTSDSSLLQDQIVRFGGPFSDQPGEPLGVFISDELLDNNQPILFHGNYLYIGNYRHSNQGNVLRYTLEGEFDREFIANGSGGLTEPSYLSFHAGNLFVNNQSSVVSYK